MTLRKIWCGIIKKLKFLPQKSYVKYYYEYYTGKKLDYKNPVEFNQKISWYKVFYQPEILNQLVDKYAVREYVKEKIGEEYLNECYGVFSKPSEINFNDLPDSYVLKGVHGYGFNLIVPKKTELNVSKAKMKLLKWYNKNQYYRGGMEWAYKDIKPRFILEKYLSEFDKDSITDYKFYCFNGKPKFLEVHLDRNENHKSAFYDLDFKKMPFRDVSEDMWIQHEENAPSNFEEMKQVAEKLADKFPFVRVDMYSINNKIIFGEMTFYPADARDDFYPEKYNKIIGDYFKLPEIPKGQERITIY